MKTRDRHTNQTFSLPQELVEELHKYVKNMERSAYVAELLKEGLEKKKEAIRQAYIQMGKDEEQQRVMKDWDRTVGDDLEEKPW